MNEKELRFGFGANWQSFINAKLDAPHIAKAQDSLKRMLQVDNLRGQVFLDIGCGSGLFSLAAYRLGAERVIAFDYDPDSVQASIATRTRMEIPDEYWQIMQGSILDVGFLVQIESANVVYAWGVLHHTGAMWQAIDYAIGKVKPGGLLAVALYNQVDRWLGGSAMWWQIKRFYNRSPRLAKRFIEIIYVIALIGSDMIRSRDPFTTIKSYNAGDGRGMDFWHDVRDWLGGFPYEYASPQAVCDYVRVKFDLQLEYLSLSNGNGCNEFTFRRLQDSR